MTVEVQKDAHLLLTAVAAHVSREALCVISSQATSVTACSDSKNLAVAHGEPHEVFAPYFQFQWFEIPSFPPFRRARNSI